MKLVGVFPLFVLLLLAVSCSSEPTFVVRGSVAGASGKTLYLEHQGLNGNELVDSVVLNESGRFKFEEELPEYPEFYRLRLEKQQIPFAVDTVNNNIQITSDAQSFATGYSVEGSTASEQIREIWLANLDANLSVSRLLGSRSSGIIDEETYRVSVDSVLGEYKELATKYIYSAPASSPAYYALFQQVNGQLIFNPYDPEDSKAFAAVANVMNGFYPDNPRTEHLYNLALRSIAVVRQTRKQQASREEASVVLDVDEPIREIGYFDFTLPQADGSEVQFSEMAKGRPTLLSFTTMAASWAGQYNQVLKDIYEVYSSRGLRIIQVGLDSDGHIWHNSVVQLPFINVQDKDGLYSELVGLYNIVSLPTIYLLSREGDIVARVERLEELPSLIEQIL